MSPPAPRDRHLRRLGVARVRAADRATRTLLGPLAGDLPASSIRSVAEVAFRDDIAPHLVAIHPWRAATVATYDLPADLGPSFRRDKAFDARALLELRDVVVSSRSGAVWVVGGPLVEESVGALRRAIWWGDVRPELTLAPAPVSHDGVVVACPPTPYFHWVLETLPGLIGALGRQPDAALLVPSAVPAYVTSALEVLRAAGLWSGATLVADRPVALPHVLVAAVEPFAGFVHPEDLADLRRVVTPHAATTPATSRQVYVSRRRAAARALPGEAALEAALVGEGVEVVHAEDLSLPQQVRMFADAELVVAAHGAGLANLAWADGPHVVEVFPHGYRNDCFARLACAVGATYVHAVADPDGVVDPAAVLTAARRRGPSPS